MLVESATGMMGVEASAVVVALVAVTSGIAMGTNFVSARAALVRDSLTGVRRRKPGL